MCCLVINRIAIMVREDALLTHENLFAKIGGALQFPVLRGFSDVVSW